MPVIILFIASLILFAFLFPERVLYFVRTVRQWLDYRQAMREEWSARKKQIHAANVAWKQYLEGEHARLPQQDTIEEKVGQLRRSLAAGQRYLKRVSADECPSNYKHTDEFCRWAENKLAELDAEKQ